jgi:archaellum biogenesis ATPase FlaH
MTHTGGVTDFGLSLGAAAVKIACKIWLRDHAIAEDASLEVTDILNAKIADARSRRRVQRQFDQLEETVADRIMAVLGHEFRALDEGERTAAVLAARHTLNCARLTDADLFDADLDPIYLERHIRKGTRGATRDLSEVGSALYDRLLTECCTDIVELTTVLPEFGPAAFVEILRRETRLIDMVRDLLERVPAREVGGPRGTADAEFAAAYRAQVVNRLDRLRLFGVTQLSQRYPLSVAYVSLNVTVGGRPRDARASGAMSSGSGRVGEQEGTDSVVRIEGALNRSSRLLIRGEAGSGKTTLLQWLAVRSARYDFGEPLAQWNALVPFFVQLRQYVGRDLPEPAEFVRHVGRHLVEKVPQGWVSDLMASGLALVLIDGVDELPGRQRIGARRWLRELIEDFPEARYIVTSRPAAVRKGWLEADGFLSADLEPMSPTDVACFVSKWHEAVGNDSVDEGLTADLDLCAHKLREALAQRRHLRQLATSPLMCALLCALHYDRRTQLPRDRLEIYDAALEMLLERRDAERGVTEEISGFSRRRKMIILQAIAYWLVRNGWSDTTRGRAIDQVRNYLTTMPDVCAEPSVVLQVLMERSGILREPVPGRVDFVHRTFQEYLAARAIVDAGDLGVLLQHAHDDLWHEVVVLAVGYAGEATREELLSGLLALAEDAPVDKSDRLHLVALACLETAPQVSAQPRREIEQRTARLLPPVTVAQAEAIAKSGEFGLELLMGQQIRTARQAAAGIRAASLIGGEQALDFIDACSRRPTKAIIEELLRAWPRFDPEVFARSILAKIDLGPFLNISDPGLLPALRFIQPQSLSLSFAPGYGDISPIEPLRKLRYFSVRDPLLTRLAPLRECPDLESAELWQTGRIDLAELRGCTNLKHLDFDYNSAGEPSALRRLTQLENIQVLGMGSFEPIQEILPLESRLCRFGIWNAREVQGLSGMTADSRLSGLTFLLLGGCRRLSSIAGIEAWTDTLTGIFLQAACLQDYQLLGELGKLEVANLSFIPIKNLSFIRRLNKLQLLHLGGMAPLPSLEPLQELPQLTRLYLHGRDDVDLAPLAGKEGIKICIENGRHRNVCGTDLLGKGSTVVRMRR